MKFGSIVNSVIVFTFPTRMHSSRMRTASSLTASRSIRWGACMPGRGACAQGVCARGGHACLGRGACVHAQGEGVCMPGGHAWYAQPPVNRMTDACNNITLPQTSFSGGKYYHRLRYIQSIIESLLCLPLKIGPVEYCDW